VRPHATRRRSRSTTLTSSRSIGRSQRRIRSPYSDSLHLDFLHQFGRDDVREVLEGLPEHYRVPLLLVHVDGYQVKEAAQMLETPLGTMLSRLHRGRKLFERRLWEYAQANDLLREPAR